MDRDPIEKTQRRKEDEQEREKNRLRQFVPTDSIKKIEEVEEEEWKTHDERGNSAKLKSSRISIRLNFVGRRNMGKKDDDTVQYRVG